MSVPLGSHQAAIIELGQEAGRLLLALDFDGTLAAIVDYPERARIPERTMAVLRRLTTFRHISVCILSGRSIADLRRRIDLDCIYAGDHGLQIEGCGIQFTHQGAEALRSVVDLICWDLDAALGDFPGIFVERKGLTATVHYRQTPTELRPRIVESIRSSFQSYHGLLRLRSANQAWEILPDVDWNKGSAMKFILGRMGEPAPLVVCAGDDATDEDMFTAVPGAISIQIGGRAPTMARYNVPDPPQLAAFLDDLMSAAAAEGQIRVP